LIELTVARPIRSSQALRRQSVTAPLLLFLPLYLAIVPPLSLVTEINTTTYINSPPAIVQLSVWLFYLFPFTSNPEILPTPHCPCCMPFQEADHTCWNSRLSLCKTMCR